METIPKKKSFVILRWIAFLPCAVIASLLGWYVANILGRIGISVVGLDLKSFIAQLYFNTIGSAAMTMAFVYVGAAIAPFYRKHVTYILSVVWFLFSGFTLFTGVMMKNGWAIWGSVWSLFCILYLVALIYKNEDIGLDF